MDYLVLVNKENICPKLDIKLVNTNSRYAERFCEEKTYQAYLKLKSYALENGYDIEIESAYRSIEYQQRVYDDLVSKKGEEYAKKYVALPGASEHHTGLALDICLYKDNKFIIEHDLPDDFIMFLNDNVSKFGFIIRYPKGKEEITGYNYEPWHIRYVGSDARIIMQNHLALDEYKKSTFI